MEIELTFWTYYLDPLPLRATIVYILNIGWKLLVTFCCSFSECELTFRFAICCRLSVCRLSSVCNFCAPYSGDWNFRQSFYAIWLLGHLLISR